MTNENISYNRLSDEDMQKAYKLFFGTFVSNSRLMIINLLREKRRNVSEIVQKLKTDQSSVSHDLTRLKNCGFVKAKAEGAYRYYELNTETIKPLMKIIDKHMSAHCLHIIQANKGGKR
ncbi:MAG: metalloregulator ArsR/SmtB family transcription factor [Nanoarchaeota archaeon]